jgi:gluconolactonase
MMNIKKFLPVLTVLLMGFSYIQNEGLKDILQPGAVIEKLADGFLFTEGPSADSKGNVYFTDQPNDRIMVWSTSDQLSTFMQPS